MKRIAILDDWQHQAEKLTDWSAVRAGADLVFFQDAFANEDDAAAKLADFDAVVAMRERTPFPERLLARLPRLKLLSFTGARNAAIDIPGCTTHGVLVCFTTGKPATFATAELALGLILAAEDCRDVPGWKISIEEWPLSFLLFDDIADEAAAPDEAFDLIAAARSVNVPVIVRLADAVRMLTWRELGASLFARAG